MGQITDLGAFAQAFRKRSRVQIAVSHRDYIPKLVMVPANPTTSPYTVQLVQAVKPSRLIRIIDPQQLPISGAQIHALFDDGDVDSIVYLGVTDAEGTLPVPSWTATAANRGYWATGSVVPTNIENYSGLETLILHRGVMCSIRLLDDSSEGKLNWDVRLHRSTMPNSSVSIEVPNPTRLPNGSYRARLPLHADITIRAISNDMSEWSSSLRITESNQAIEIERSRGEPTRLLVLELGKGHLHSASLTVHGGPQTIFRHPLRVQKELNGEVHLTVSGRPCNVNLTSESGEKLILQGKAGTQTSRVRVDFRPGIPVRIRGKDLNGNPLVGMRVRLRDRTQSPADKGPNTKAGRRHKMKLDASRTWTILGNKGSYNNQAVELGPEGTAELMLFPGRFRIELLPPSGFEGLTLGADRGIRDGKTFVVTPAGPTPMEHSFSASRPCVVDVRHDGSDSGPAAQQWTVRLGNRGKLISGGGLPFRLAVFDRSNPLHITCGTESSAQAHKLPELAPVLRVLLRCR